MLALTQKPVQKLISARLAANSMGVPMIVLAQTDANVATHQSTSFFELKARQ